MFKVWIRDIVSQVKERVQREDDAESVENLKKTLQEVELKGIATVHKMNTYILYSYFTMDFFAAQEVQKKRAEVEEEGGGGAGAGVEVNISIGIFTGVFRHTALGRLNTGESCIITI